MESAQLTMRYRIWFVLGFLALVFIPLLLLPFATVAVWDGRFGLTIHVNPDPTINMESVRFATCWDQAEATYFLSQTDDRFGPVWSNASRSAAENYWTIDVPCSGRSHRTGLGDTYVEPRFLVVEFESTTGGERTLHRKQFTIPKGHGLRSMTIQLP